HVHHVVAAHESVLGQYLAARVDQERDVRPRLAHEDAHRLAQQLVQPPDVAPPHCSASTARSVSSRIRPSCASRSAITTTINSRLPATTTCPSSVSSWSEPSPPNAASRAACSVRRNSDAVNAATASPEAPAPSSDATGTPASASTISA